MIVIKLLAECRIFKYHSLKILTLAISYMYQILQPLNSQEISRFFMLKIFHACHVTIFIQWDNKDTVNEFKCPIMSEKVYIYKSTIDV